MVFIDCRMFTLNYYLVENVEKLLWQAEKQAGKKHRLNVRYQLRLSHQPVQACTLLKALEIIK